MFIRSRNTLDGLFILLLLLASINSEASSGITYHGRILRPDNSSVTSATTQFRIQLRTPGVENCLLWEEQQTKDLSSTAGVFSLTIADTAEPSLIANILPFPLERVFSNRLNFSSLTSCSVGNSYNPTPTDGRTLVVFFRESPTDAWEQMPLTKINFVPMALNSVQLEGHRASEFLKVDASSSYAALTPTQVNTLMDIISGTNSQYLQPTTTFIGDMSGTYNATSVDKIKGVAVNPAAPTNGQVLKFNGTNWAPATDDTGATPGDAAYNVKGIVQINTDLATSGLYISSGVLALPNLITANGPIGNAQTVPIITYDQKGRLTAVTTATVDDNTKLPLSGGAMTGSINMGGQNITNAASLSAANASLMNLVLNDNDTNTVTVKTPADIAANYTLTLPADDGSSSGQVLSTDGSGNLAWSAANNNLGLTSNQAVVANGTGTALINFTCSLNQVFGFDATGLPTCLNVTSSGGFLNDGNSFGAAATIGTNDNFDLNFETNGSTRITVRSSGNVGIGTSTPTTPLSIQTATAGNVELLSLKNSNGGGNAVGMGFYVGGTKQSEIYSFDNNMTFNAATASSAMIWRINNTIRMVLDSSGNFGIGTASPNTILDVNGAVSQRGMTAPSVSPAGQGRIYFDSTANKFKISENNGNYVDLVNSSSGTVSGTTGKIAKFTSSTAVGDSVIVESGGKIGIGTATPNAQVEVAGVNSSSAYGTGEQVLVLRNTNATFGSRGAGIRFDNGAYTSGAAQIDLISGGTLNEGHLSFGTRDSGDVMSERMRISSAGNVGIGTTNPHTALHVASANGKITVGDTTETTGATTGLQFRSTSQSAGYTKGAILFENTGAGSGRGMMHFALNGAASASSVSKADAKMTILDSGYVGIGTVSPSAPLHVVGTANTLVVDGYSNDSLTPGLISRKGRGTVAAPAAVQAGDILAAIIGSGHTGTNFPSNQVGVVGRANETFSAGSQSTYITFETTALGQTSRAERIRIDPSGNVGIGTVSPADKLSVWNDYASDNNSVQTVATLARTAASGVGATGIGSRLRFAAEADDGNIRYPAGVVGLLSNATAGAVTGDLAFETSFSGALYERMRVSSSGNVGIGTSSPGAALEVNAAFGDKMILKSSNNGRGLRFSHDNLKSSIIASSGDDLHLGNDNTGTALAILNSGEVGIGTTTPSYKLHVVGDINSTVRLRIAGNEVCTSTGCTTSSDERLKENIEPLENSLEKILSLRGVEYDYRDKQKFGPQHHVGVIAQEVEKIYPEVVKTDSITGFKSVAYQNLVAPLIEAIKSLYSMFEAESRSKDQKIKELETRIEKLEKALQPSACLDPGHINREPTRSDKH